MTKNILLLTACALVSQALAEPPAPTAVSLYKQGLAAEKAGNVAAANGFYMNALKLDPRNPDIRYSLGQLKINSASISAKSREAKFGAVVIPVFQLEEATLKESLEAFGAHIEKQSKNEVTPNFVIEDPKNLLADRKLTMLLKNMPAQGIMKYLLDQAGAKARYDEHAVVITPR